MTNPWLVTRSFILQVELPNDIKARCHILILLLLLTRFACTVYSLILLLLSTHHLDRNATNSLVR
jgi:hypothetical protein